MVVSNYRMKYRIITAMILSLLMVFNSAAIGFAGTDSNPDSFTFTVKNSSGAVTDAAIIYTATLDGVERTNGTINVDNNGEGVMPTDGLTSYLSDSESQLSIAYKVNDSSGMTLYEDTYETKCSLSDGIKDNVVVTVPDVYVLTLEKTGAGTITIDDEEKNEVKYLGEKIVKVTVKPSEGNWINKVTVNNEEITDSSKATDLTGVDGTLQFKLSVNESTRVKVEFKAIPALAFSTLKFDRDSAVFSKDGLFVYKSGTTINFSTDYDALYLDDGNTSSSINKSKQIKMAKTGDVLYDVIDRFTSIELPNNKLNIIIDEDSPLIDVTVDNSIITTNGFYNEDIPISITVEDLPSGIENLDDSPTFAGIEKIEYWVERDGVITQGKGLDEPSDYVLYQRESDEVQDKITVETAVETEGGKNDGENTQLYVQATDIAGNVSEYKCVFKISVTAPQINISIGGEMKEGAKDGFYASNRTASIEIEDKAKYFDEEYLLSNLNIECKNKDGGVIPVDKDKMITISHDGDNHVAKIDFQEDGYYSWSFNYKNITGMEGEIVKEEGNHIYEFVVDKNYPTGEIKSDKNVFSNLLEKITFGLFNNSTLTLEPTGDDATSVVSMSYYKTSETSAMDIHSLDSLEETAFIPIELGEKIDLNPDDKHVVYLKLMDEAGNYVYICSDGHILDSVSSDIEISISNESESGIYNSDVTVDVKVKDPEVYSGINSVTYRIEKDGLSDPTQSGVLYKFETETPAYEDLVSEWTGEIVVESEKNNSSNVTVYVTATDNAGNQATKSIDLDIDITEPSISIEYEGRSNEAAYNESFFTERRAVVTINERTNHFDSEKATEAIKSILAVDLSGKDITDPITIGEWTTIADDKNPDLDSHSVIVEFNKDANYSIEFNYTDEAGNESTKIDAGNAAAPFSFTVDKTIPEGTITATTDKNRKKEWNILQDDLVFNIWAKDYLTISATAKDETSPILKTEYYLVEAEKIEDVNDMLSMEDLKNVPIESWNIFNEFKLNPESRAVVYLKITDYSGNECFISTNGLIVDSNVPDWESVAPEIKVTPQQPVNGIYNGDVNVSISVNDPIIKGAFSGLKSVSYRVINESVDSAKPTQEEELFKFEEDSPKLTNLKHDYSGSIVIDASKNNSNNVKVIVSAEDNSGNISEETISLRIDTTRPSIDVSYNNNSADSGKYFKANRTAEIVITERNFDPKDVVIDVKSSNGIKPTMSGWTTISGSGNNDNTRHVMTIVYDKDSDYSFSISFKDLAGNRATGTRFASGTIAGSEFTIDKTIPTISVSYNNNNATNGNYYKDARTATITINEHNFDASRVTTRITAVDNGNATTVPSISGWSQSGDIHTATISYPGDALYTFDIDYTDLAGNAAADYTQESFYVDKTAPKIVISGVSNNSANKGVVAPIVEYSDTNIEGNAKISLVGANRKSVDLIGVYANIPNGRRFAFEDFKHEKLIDDIYTLTVSLSDRAGNITTEEITFSVNRFGSTYALSKDTERKNGKYSQSGFDAVVTETNVDELKNIVITLFKNNKTVKLEEGKDYSITATGGNGEWYKYVYTVFAKNFEDDGTYRLTFRSEDAAGNIAENTLDTKGAEVTFGIDKTLPTINVKNVEDNMVYALDKLPVEMTVRDNLFLSKVEVYLDGILHKVWSDNELSDVAESGGDFLFDILGDSVDAHELRVVAYDAAGNSISEDVLNFYVTTNAWVRFYNNKPLFYGTLIGILALIAGFIFFIVAKRRKKEEETESV